MIKADKGSLIELVNDGKAISLITVRSTYEEENGFIPIASSYGRIRNTGYLLQGKTSNKLYVLLTSSVVNEYETLRKEYNE